MLALFCGMVFLVLRPDRAFASTLLTETFESYSAASINGQGGWVSTTTIPISVGTTPVKNGVRSAGYYGSSVGTKFATRDIGSDMDATGGKGYIAVWMRANNIEDQDVGVKNHSGMSKSGIYCDIGLKQTAGQAVITTATTETSLASGLVADTWYYLELEMDFDTDLCRGRIDGGAWSVTTAGATTAGEQRWLFIHMNTGISSAYIDDIVVTDGAADPIEDDTTRFISFTPTLGVTTKNATSTTFQIGATGYINATSTEDDMYLYVRWRNVSQGTIGGAGGCSTFSNSFNEFEIEIATSSLPDFATTSPQQIVCYGVYGVYMAVKYPAVSIFGYSLYDRTLIEITSTFVVGTTTNNQTPSDTEIETVDYLFQSGFSDDIYLPNEANASSTILNLSKYLNLREQIAGKFPLSWAIETVATIIDAANQTSTTTMTAYNLDFGNATTLTWFATSTHSKSVNVWNWEWIDDLANSTAWGALLVLVIGIMWIGLGVFAWSEAQRMWRELQN